MAKKIFSILGILFLVAACSTTDLADVRGLGKNDVVKQLAWTVQMEQVVTDQVMDFRIEIARLAKTDNGFEAAMDMRIKLLVFMEEWRPNLIVERFFDRLKEIRKGFKEN